jgi:hypothetical protein
MEATWIGGLHFLFIGMPRLPALSPNFAHHPVQWDHSVGKSVTPWFFPEPFHQQLAKILLRRARPQGFEQIDLVLP